MASITKCSSTVVGVQLFEFSTSDVLDSVLFSGRSPRYEISTNHRRRITTIRRCNPERTVCTIGWDTKMIDIPNQFISRQHISDWIPLNPRRKTRKLSFGNVEYTWIPKKDGFSLFNKGTNMANIWTLRNQLPRLEIDCHSAHTGLLDACVIAAVLFLSKKNLDADRKDLDHDNV